VAALVIPPLGVVPTGPRLADPKVGAAWLWFPPPRLIPVPCPKIPFDAKVFPKVTDRDQPTTPRRIQGTLHPAS
jgi:hypothetical protein